MKKIALMLVAAATLAASVSAPAEARGVRVARPAAAIAVATAAAIAADAYYSGGYYTPPGVAYYSGPAYWLSGCSLRLVMAYDGPGVPGSGPSSFEARLTCSRATL
jgi:hypothetical protein